MKLTLKWARKAATGWTSRVLAKKTGLSQLVISLVWRVFGLQRHRTQGFQFSSDLLWAEKVRDMTGLYMNPPDHALVLCVDERSQIPALNRNPPIFLIQSGRDKRRSHD